MIPKFRAWDKKRKEMGGVAIIEWNPDFSIKRALLVFQISVNEPNDDIEKIWVDGHDIILEQYTGLKDKNGDEVYAGSKLKITVQNGEGIEEFKNFTYGIVVWSEHALEWGIDFGDTMYPEPLADYEDIEIIGTIHDKE